MEIKTEGKLKEKKKKKVNYKIQRQSAMRTHFSSNYTFQQLQLSFTPSSSSNYLSTHQSPPLQQPLRPVPTCTLSPSASPRIPAAPSRHPLPYNSPQQRVAFSLQVPPHRRTLHNSPQTTSLHPSRNSQPHSAAAPSLLHL